MAIPLLNASSFPLTYTANSLPQMESALENWYLPMTFTIVVKNVVNSEVIETRTDVDFQGVWQPLSVRELALKPEGERKWKYYRVHAPIGLVLKPDMCIEYQGTQYRVSGEWNYKEYAYVEYELVEDFEGSGPY